MIRVELITPHAISITIYKHERSLFNCLFHQGYLILFEDLILWVYSASTGALCVKILFMKNDSINTFCRNWSDITNLVHNPSMYLSSWVWMLQYSKTAQACTISIKTATATKTTFIIEDTDDAVGKGRPEPSVYRVLPTRFSWTRRMLVCLPNTNANNICYIERKWKRVGQTMCLDMVTVMGNGQVISKNDVLLQWGNISCCLCWSI